MVCCFWDFKGRSGGDGCGNRLSAGDFARCGGAVAGGAGNVAASQEQAYWGASVTRTLRKRHAMVWLALLPAIVLSIIVIRLVQTSHDERGGGGAIGSVPGAAAVPAKGQP